MVCDAAVVRGAVRPGEELTVLVAERNVTDPIDDAHAAAS